MNEAEALAAEEGRATEGWLRPSGVGFAGHVTSLSLQVDCPHLPELKMVKMLRCRVRYFTDGAVIGSKEFVNEAFAGARDRFTERRKDGARRLRGNAKEAAGLLWSARDLRVGIV
jgi:hypothetical protein